MPTAPRPARVSSLAMVQDLRGLHCAILGAMSQVQIRQCRTYERALVSEAVRSCFDVLPSASRLLRRGARVLVKPNVINARPPERAVCTHPEVVRAVAEIALEAGCEVLVADEPGYALTGAPELVFQSSGIAQGCEGLPVEFDMLKRGGYRTVKVPHPLQLETVSIARRALEADVVINLAKCKTHPQTLLTGAVKNMFGTVAPRERIQIHTLGTFKALGEALADTFSGCVPHINVMDAVIGMEGKGPSHGVPRPMGLICASEDAVALDAVMEHITGFAPGEVRTTTAAAEKGLGECDLSRIQVQGADLASLRHPLKRAPGGIRHGFPGWVGHLLRDMIWVRPLVDPTVCIRCGACAGICPAHAVTVEDFAVIDYHKCLECFCCQEVCPVGAIDTRRSWLARRIIGRPADRH